MSSIFGHLFTISTFGESHGPALGVVVDGCPPGLPLTEAEIQRELDRRRPGQSLLVTQRKEGDVVRILSGVYEGATLGTPIGMVIENTDQRPSAYAEMRAAYRPSHADFTYDAKYGRRAVEGGGRASARETAARVAAGAIAKKLLANEGVELIAYVERIHDLTLPHPAEFPFPTLAEVEASPTRCPHPATAAAMAERIQQVRAAGDSVGGIICGRVRGLPAGLGEPVFDRLEADLAKAMLSLPATKGFELGSGFAGTLLKGSEHNDRYVRRADGSIGTATNRSGGIQGGISNGEEIVFRVAFKPTATILQEQETLTAAGEAATLQGKGRHDPCVLPRAVPIVEAMTALVLVDHWLRQHAQRHAFRATPTINASAFPG